jgi:hypothetical protein
MTLSFAENRYPITYSFVVVVAATAAIVASSFFLVLLLPLRLLL